MTRMSDCEMPGPFLRGILSPAAELDQARSDGFDQRGLTGDFDDVGSVAAACPFGVEGMDGSPFEGGLTSSRGVRYMHNPPWP